MLDIANDLISKPTNDWRVHLNWGDVVSFRFPVASKGAKRPPKAQPCAILNVSTMAGECFTTLVCSADISIEAQADYETHVTRPDALHVAGLNGPTVFDSCCRITVSLNHKGFDLRTGGTPVLGLLTGPERDRFNVIRARVQADVDMAVSHRAEQRRMHSLLIPERKQSVSHQVTLAPCSPRWRIRPIALV